MSEESFIGFLCGNCQTELEATQDMIGEETECPACGARLVVPAPTGAGESDGVVRHSEGDLGNAAERLSRAGPYALSLETSACEPTSQRRQET